MYHFALAIYVYQSTYRGEAVALTTSRLSTACEHLTEMKLPRLALDFLKNANVLFRPYSMRSNCSQRFVWLRQAANEQGSVAPQYSDTLLLR